MLMNTDKIDRNMPYTFAQMEDVDVLICEKPLPEEIARAAAEAQVTIL
jgi:DeoR/GlpR family transcriptional regulator of sugar metabolism